jgi:hypothetical protein
MAAGQAQNYDKIRDGEDGAQVSQAFESEQFWQALLHF